MAGEEKRRETLGNLARKFMGCSNLEEQKKRDSVVCSHDVLQSIAWSLDTTRGPNAGS